MSRPTVAEIDLGAIAHNLGEVRRLVGRGVMVCPAVKADAYGHGSVQVSNALVELGADMLGVSSVDEASELRNAGIDAPVLVLGCILPEEVPQVVQMDVTSTVCSVEFADRLSAEAQRAGRTAKVHVKVDTGMGRVGVRAEDAEDLVLAVSDMSHLEIEGIFTHLPCADEPESVFTTRQVAEFREVVESIEAKGCRIALRHAANSAAIVNSPDAYFNMVRPGIMLYGLYDGELTSGVELQPALTLKSRIVFLKEVSPGTSISYGRTFSAQRKTVVGTIPVGYADGYNRRLSNKGSAIVHGRRVPVIGRVCMDQTMLDVTDAGGVRVGDEVVIYGRQGDQEIRIEEVASLLDTISYEVACWIGKRVPRVYVG